MGADSAERVGIVSTFSEFVREYTHATERHPSWRRGQAAFNTLSSLHPDLAEKVRGTAIDPFYRDEIGTRFWAFVSEALGDRP